MTCRLHAGCTVSLWAVRPGLPCVARPAFRCVMGGLVYLPSLCSTQTRATRRPSCKCMYSAHVPVPVVTTSQQSAAVCPCWWTRVQWLRCLLGPPQIHYASYLCEGDTLGVWLGLVLSVACLPANESLASNGPALQVRAGTHGWLVVNGWSQRVVTACASHPFEFPGASCNVSCLCPGMARSLQLPDASDVRVVKSLSTGCWAWSAAHTTGALPVRRPEGGRRGVSTRRLRLCAGAAQW